MPQQKKKVPEPERKPNPYLGWIAAIAIIAAIAVFLYTRQDQQAPTVVPSQASVAQAPTPEPQSATSTPAPPQTQSAPSKAAPSKPEPQTAVTPKPEHHEKSAQSVPSPVSAQQQPEYRMPAYYEDPDAAEPLKPTLDPDTVQPHAREAYEVAKRKPRLLAQLPCFCYCDRFGHKSLHDCYVGNHAEECEVCMREALEADQMDNQGMTPQEIRAAIIANHHPRTQ